MGALHWTNVALLPLFAGVLFLFLFVPVWKHRNRALGRAFLIFLAASAVWALGYVVELCAVDLHTALFWANVQYFGVPGTPPTLFAFVLLLSGVRSNHWKLWLGLTIPYLLTCLAAWTDDRLHLLRHDVRFVWEGSFYAVTFEKGPAYLLNIAISYVYLAITIGLLLRLALDRNALPRKQAAVILCSLALPVAGNLMRIVGYEPIPGIDQTPVLFALSAFAFAYGLVRWSLVSVAPIARSKVVDELADGVVVLDAEGHVLDANPAAARLFGMSANEVAQATVEDLADRLPENRLPADSESTLEMDGRSYFLRRIPVDGKEGSLGSILQFTDVTDQRRAEEALRRAKEAAEEASAAKSRFVANISHELRTPLNGVIGLSEMLAETALSETQQEYLTGIRQCSKTLLSLISDVLDLSRLDADAMPISEEPVDLAALIEEVCGVHRQLALGKGLTLSATVAGLPPYVSADPLRLRQILNNLIGNALKFTSEGGVRVSVGPVEAGRYEIVVADTGIGIPSDKLGTVFEAFQQADESTTRRYGGTGLGLPIAHSLVRRMGGGLSATSTVGRGTTMRVVLPLAEAGKLLPESAEEEPPTGLRVLVAEDNTVNALVITSLLERFGCRADHRMDGLAALQVYETEDFDLVLLDIQMPVLDGIETCRAMRQQWPARRTPIYALTASAFVEERERAAAAGMDGFLTKPLRREDLADVLRTVGKAKKAAAPR